ncbi:MAG: M48 family metalloprotease [Patescibacteria group bacterium]|nr:M48 family metalloprotease [Patescibacteria group bacterium]
MQKGARQIYIAFQGKLIGTSFMKRAVCETLTRMPQGIIDYITKNCWFFASMEDAWAFTFTGNDLKDQHLIFLSDDLLSQHPKQIEFSIAHEIGHVMLGHRNSILERQTKQEVRHQEKEADKFARQFIF